MNKFSRYNQLFAVGENSVLYNTASDGIIVMLPEIEDVLLDCAENPDKLSKMHPELYQTLLNKRMIVDKDEDECMFLIDTWKKEDTDPTSFSITINPTMDCNLRCWYCYEKHIKGSKMSQSLLDAIKELVKTKVADSNLKILHIDFFGGEPLLRFNETILPILNFAREQCDLYHKKLEVSFTTNAVLLTPDVVKGLQPFHKDKAVNLQITLDGSSSLHDMIRKDEDKNPTYAIILAHLKIALSEKFQINLRLNYTQKNATSFVDIIQDLRNLTKEEKERLNIDFKKVWQDDNIKEVEKIIEENRLWFEKEGFSTSYPIEYAKQRCYADKENNIVINYDGNLYNCTARNFAPENSEGALESNGTLKWNAMYAKRMAIKQGNKTCQACMIFPICHGGCSQDKIEADNAEGCIRHYTEEEKQQILIGRVNYLLKTAK